MKAIEIIVDPRKAQVLVDPMRREIVRLLAESPITQNKLAEALGFSDASISHHLKILKQEGLIKVVKKEIEEHGIVQKFYQTNALIYLVNLQEMPLEITRYFMPASLERARGVIAALSASGDDYIKINTKELENFAKIYSQIIIQVSIKYLQKKKIDREELMSILYRDALIYLKKNQDLISEKLRTLMSKWRFNTYLGRDVEYHRTSISAKRKP